ncbi:transmembrane protein 275 [Syngnathoides biaculeatus]|uniref:transmembrane protein 275 n=1 Tax=Syngnathoides biaculeatus TaxID=300417 RepID=UPI002ADE1F71|nr:transmembrane protein 275 [Syngnathoides biaculeatus]
MVVTDRNAGASASKKEPAKDKKRRWSRPHGLPSPALCCACGLCVMLAGLNITLVGVFAFRTLVPSANPSIVIGPILLLVAFSFFGACCVCSRLPPPPHGSRGAKTGARGLNLIGNGGMAGGAAFEIETSEHTLQDTTAVQLSPTSSPASSRGSGSENVVPDASLPGTCQLFTMEKDGLPDSSAAIYSGGQVRLNLPREEAAA